VNARVNEGKPVAVGYAVIAGRAGNMFNVNQGAAQPTINLKELKEFKIPVPPPPLQKQFVALVTQHEQLRAAHVEAIRQANAPSPSLRQLTAHGVLPADTDAIGRHVARREAKELKPPRARSLRGRTRNLPTASYGSRGAAPADRGQ
jgi:hypothetical protein